ncbi:MAG: hypothetical protein AAF358_05615 [Pseudomonadota bacterium]
MKAFGHALLLFLALLWASKGSAQPNDVIFIGDFEPRDFVYQPNEPLDVLFFCELFYTDDSTLSQNRYYFDFAFDGAVQGGFQVDTGDFVTVNGNYTITNGQITFDATNGFGADFAMTTNTITPRLGIPGFFGATGNGLGRPAQLACIAIGHGYDTATEVYERYECQDQLTAAGTYSNVIELNAFDSTINLFVPGAAFRQRDFFASGTTTGDPTLIERNDFGIYRRDGNRVFLDFTLGPLPLSFSDWNTATADAVNNSLAIGEFDPPLPPCQRVD